MTGLYILFYATPARSDEILVIEPGPDCVDVEAIVRAYWSDAPVMIEIARAESEFSPTADNPNSTAKGLFQILDGTWEDYGCQGDVLDIQDNLACARLLYEESGTTPWNASKDKWSNPST